MYIFLILGCILMAAGAWMMWKGRKLEQQTVAEIQIKYKDELAKELAEFTDACNKTEKALRERVEVAKQRAAEAQEHTDTLVAAEQQRLAAELQHKKELEEVKIQQEHEKQIEQLRLLYQREDGELHAQYVLKQAKYQRDIDQLKAEFDEFAVMQQAVNEAILRQKELKEKEDFYSIIVPENDREDIKVLQSMDLKLHNRDVIPKLIWELYIRRPCQEMIKRVTGGRKISGIYKITYKETGEAYIGKTTDFATRWQNHCKTAIGLEGAARATLHNRLGQDGLWNYTFEILEEVDKDNLSSREAFYIDLYGTKSQLNMKSGDKNGTQ